MDDLLAHPYPTIRAAGLFLIGVGTVFAIAWLDAKRFGLWMALAFAVGGFGAYVGYALPPDLGDIRSIDICVYASAFAFEVIGVALIYMIVKEERAQDAWILMIVGAHFAPMALAFGPMALVLSLVCMANAANALARPTQPILLFGLVDSAAKVFVGALLFLIYPNWQLPNLV